MTNAPTPLTGRQAMRLPVVYYAEPHEYRDGKCYAPHEYRFRSFKGARAWLDARGGPGSVNAWSERQQQRTHIADRSASGEWTSRDPYTGETVVLP